MSSFTSRPPLAKAEFIALSPDLTTEASGEDRKRFFVQFNPESLKLTFSNEVKQPASSDAPEGGADTSAGTAGIQFVGAGTTKLAIALWFDVTGEMANPVDDVRRLTADVLHFMKPRPVEGEEGKVAPPGLRISWGSFLFDGVVESLEENLDWFSPAGLPLRASIALSMVQQKILVPEFAPATPGAARARPRPFTPARAGQSLQAMAMAAAAGATTPWQAIAAANGIEDPLRLAAGTLVDLAARAIGFAANGGRR